MPAYNTYPFSKTIYAQQETKIVGYDQTYGTPAHASAAEAIANAYKSIPVCIATSGIQAHTGRIINWQIVFGVAPATITLVLEGSMTDVDAEYAAVDQSTSITGETRQVASNLKFFRVHATALTGSGATAGYYSVYAP